jgi:hypothetical protein
MWITKVIISFQANIYSRNLSLFSGICPPVLYNYLYHHARMHIHSWWYKQLIGTRLCPGYQHFIGRERECVEDGDPRNSWPKTTSKSQLVAKVGNSLRRGRRMLQSELNVEKQPITSIITTDLGKTKFVLSQCPQFVWWKKIRMSGGTQIYIYIQKSDCESGFLETIWGSDDGTRLCETIFFFWILSTDLILKGARSFGGRFCLCPRVKQGRPYSVKNYYEGQTPRKIFSLAFFWLPSLKWDFAVADLTG